MNLRKVLAFSVGPLGSAILGLITLPIVAWLFSPEDIGRLTMLNVTVSFTLLLFSLGLDQAYVREFHEVQDKPSLLKAVFIPGFMTLLLAIICLFLSPWSLSLLLFDIDSQFLTGFLYGAIFLSFGSRFLSLILRMQERGLAFSMSQLIPKLLFLLIIISYALFDLDANFKDLIAANFVAIFTVFLVFVWNTRKDWMPALSASIDKGKQFQMIHYSIPLIGSGIAFWGLTTMDKFFLRSLSSFEELGVYSIAVSFAGAALVFQVIFSTVWSPVVYKWASEGVETKKIIDVMDYVALAVFSIWSLSGMFSWLVTYILPSEYYKVQHILLAGMAYPLLYTLSESTGIGIGIQRKTIFSFGAAITALLINGVSNWFLIPSYGAAGAAIGSAIAFFVFFVVRTEASARFWVSFHRYKIYFFTTIYMLLSVLINISSFEFFYVSFFYFVSLIFVVISYWVKIKILVRVLLSRFFVR